VYSADIRCQLERGELSVDTFKQVLLYFIQGGQSLSNGAVRGFAFGAFMLMIVPLVLARIEGRVKGNFGRQFWSRNIILTLLLGVASAAYALTQRGNNHIIEQLRPVGLEMIEFVGVLVAIMVAFLRRRYDGSWKGLFSGTGLWSLVQGFFAGFLAAAVLFAGFFWPPLLSLDATCLRLAMLLLAYGYYRSQKQLVTVDPTTKTKIWHMPHVDTTDVSRRRRIVSMVLAVGVCLALPFIF